MKRAIFLLSLVLTALGGNAGEIVGWNVPLYRFAEHGRWAEGVVRCEAAPEASPFFNEEDELWDLKGISLDLRKETSPPLEWMIWNASTGRLVVKGEQESIWQLGHRLQPLEQPKQCRLTIEVLEVPADGRPLADQQKATAGLSWITRSDVEFEVSRESEGRVIRAQGKVRMAEDSLLADVEIAIDCSVESQAEMKFNSSFPMMSGNPIWLARDFDGKEGLDLRISSSFELLDGTPVSDIMRIQHGNQTKSIKLDRHEFKKYKIGGKSSLAIQFFAPDDLMRLSPSPGFSDDPFSEPDPFSESPSKQIGEKLGLPEVAPPKNVRSWFDGPVLDIGTIIRPMGIMSDDTSAFVGYDPLTQAIFLLSDEPDEVNKFEQIFATICHLRPKIITATFDGDGQTRLVSRSGVRCSLERAVDEHHLIRSVVIEPVIEIDGTISMRIDYSDESVEGQKQFLKSSLKLNAGIASVLLDEVPNGGESASLRIKTDIQSVYD